MKRADRDYVVNARDCDWSSVYDAGLNRKPKKEAVMVVNPLQCFEEVYEYDLNDVGWYGTKNNRLIKIVRTQIDTDLG